ncbi:hypothetical protein [Actimicrobium sp. GrIS 1.19]|uniref:hypothetical protein n=1 Tax=Actimicrobium sp. GrIS 1.19 TaxID=3071708 RepID=UPI002E12F96A
MNWTLTRICGFALVNSSAIWSISLGQSGAQIKAVMSVCGWASAALLSPLFSQLVRHAISMVAMMRRPMYSAMLLLTNFPDAMVYAKPDRSNGSLQF